jgi:hypothetical protein
MNPRHCLEIAQRIDAQLTLSLGQGIAAPRMLADALYARDVLLVCDALREEGELAALARRFRAAALAPDAEPEAAVRPSSGFSASRFLSSFFGSAFTPEGDAPALRAPPRRWFGRQRGTRE